MFKSGFSNTETNLKLGQQFQLHEIIYQWWVYWTPVYRALFDKIRFGSERLQPHSELGWQVDNE